MSTETKAPPPIPKQHAEWLTKDGEAFDRILIEDETARRCFRDYCFASLDHLGVRQHCLLDMAGPDIHRPTADQEEQILQRLADAVKERHGRFYDAYEDDFLSMLQRYSYEWLTENAGYEESQTLLRNATKAIPHQVTRLWDNPVKLITDPVTGERRLDHGARTAIPLITKAQAFVRAFEPARKPGRPPQTVKPKKSGRPPLDKDLAIKVSHAFERGMRWQDVARKVLDLPIPTDLKERDRLRKKVDRLRFNGKSLS